MTIVTPPSTPGKAALPPNGRPRKLSAPPKLRGNSITTPPSTPPRSRQQSIFVSPNNTPPSSSPGARRKSSIPNPVRSNASPGKEAGLLSIAEIKKKPVLPTREAQNVTTPPKRKAALPTSATALPATTTTNSIAMARNRSTSLSGWTAPGAIVSGGLVGCVAGAAILMAIGIYYDYAGVKAAIATAKAARLAVDDLTDSLVASLQGGTYSVEEALHTLRQTTLTYAQSVPEGQPLINRIFDEVETVRITRGSEVERALGDAYEELRIGSTEGYGASEMRSVLWKHTGRLAAFTGRAIEDVLARNPALKVAVANAAAPRIGSHVLKEKKKVDGPVAQRPAITA